MHTFFKTHTQTPAKTIKCRSISFEFSPGQKPAKLFKLTVNPLKGNPSDLLFSVHENVILQNPNSIFIWTTPTSFSNGSEGTMLHAGHNFSCISDDKGEIQCSLSKTPDRKTILKRVKRVPDSRFSTQPEYINIYAPYFSTVTEELNKWWKRASLVPTYSLYVQVFPLIQKITIDAVEYKKNVNDIVSMQEPYTLHSYVSNCQSRYIPALNCNSDTNRSLFGKTCSSIQDMFCQQAAMHMVSKWVTEKKFYEDAVKEMGLDEGIQPSPIDEEMYQPDFTC